MIVKFQKADQSGWVMLDSVVKINTNTQTIRVRLNSKALEPQDYDIYHTITEDEIDLNTVDFIELDFKDVPKPTDDLYCALITATIDKGTQEKDIFIIANTNIYILNDNGKTIEHI